MHLALAGTGWVCFDLQHKKLTSTENASSQSQAMSLMQTINEQTPARWCKVPKAQAALGAQKLATQEFSNAPSSNTTFPVEFKLRFLLHSWIIPSMSKHSSYHMIH